MLSISSTEMTSKPAISIIEPSLKTGSNRRVAPFGPFLLVRLSLPASDESISFDQVSCVLQGKFAFELLAITG